MNSLMLSVKPKWCELIASGEKTLDVRKTKPRCDVPFKCYIYCTKDKAVHTNISDDKYDLIYKGNGKVIGEFICNKIERFDVPYPAFQKKLDKRITKDSCLSYYELHRYAYHDSLYGWHISDIKIYDEPKELDTFYRYCGNNPKCHNCECGYYERTECVASYECYKPITRPPQSWCYIEVKK